MTVHLSGRDLLFVNKYKAYKLIMKSILIKKYNSAMQKHNHYEIPWGGTS